MRLFFLCLAGEHYDVADLSGGQSIDDWLTFSSDFYVCCVITVESERSAEFIGGFRVILRLDQHHTSPDRIRLLF